MANIDLNKLALWDQIDFFCEPETEDPAGCFAMGEPADSETLAWIRSELNSGNQWAWCVLGVRVTLEDVRALGGCSVHGTAYIGGCSFQSREDAHESEFETLLAEARENLANQLQTRLTQAELFELGLLDGAPARYLTATFDVTGWTEEQINLLALHVQAQAEASEHDHENSETLENYPDAIVQIDIDGRE